jgi:hypothetical protein
MGLQIPRLIAQATHIDNILCINLSLPDQPSPRTNFLLKCHGNLETSPQTSFWYPLMWKWVKANPSADTSHIFPWTKEYAIQALSGESAEQIQAELLDVRTFPNAKRSLWHTDPATETWGKVQETYGSDPKNFYEQRAKAREPSRRALDH